MRKNCLNILQHNIIEIEAKAAHRELELNHEINNVRDLLNKSKFTVDRFKQTNYNLNFTLGMIVMNFLNLL